MIAVSVLAAGCSATVGHQLATEETKMHRVELAPVHTTQELQNEIDTLTRRLVVLSETVYKDELDGMQSSTVNRLVEIGQPAVVALIEGYYGALERHDLLHFRYLVLGIFQRMQEPITQDFLIQVLQRGDRKERRMAAEALWRFGDTACVGVLINALEDDSLDVVNTVAAALRAITGFNFGVYRSVSDNQRAESIARWRQWWSVTGTTFPRGRADRF